MEGKDEDDDDDDEEEDLTEAWAETYAVEPQFNNQQVEAVAAAAESTDALEKTVGANRPAVA